MKVLEIGSICVKSRGREAGRKCVIVDIVDENNVLVTGPKSLTGVRRRKVNIRHIEPIGKKVNVQKGASDEEVLKAIKESGLEDFMREKVLLAQR
ncbi:MAG: 50S ribosomal protein L14e [Acidilobaceae archaeon]|nr:50S ribosomal protein L14e [Acidilobaceae archaeon]MCX8165079.1 50S ribosomal protein L14e [Acidilobaceae archaeon]MDW7974404.1 50S ribosomal protein L14e [Sulfolobales archaeon]